jgi:3D (Asp-Asp-Asp) domain-containing protein
MPKFSYKRLVNLNIFLFVLLAVLLNIRSLQTQTVEVEQTPGHNLAPSGTMSSVPEPITLTPTLSPTTAAPKTPTPTPRPITSVSVRMTFYGWVDNDPPGKSIAYPHRRYPTAIHNEAGGLGSYENPITLAAKKGRWPVGTRFYISELKKYGILEDLCANCTDNHLDVWMESNGNYPTELLDCENRWTRSRVEAEVSPPAIYSVDLKPFFNTFTGECNR